MSIIESARRASERKRKLLEDKDTNSSKAKVVTNESKTTTNTKKSSIIESARRASQKKAETKRSYLEQSIGFDTINDDLAKTNSTIDNIYKNWQDKDSLSSAKSSVENMYNRLNAYENYRKQYGNSDYADASETLNAYKSILDDWDNISNANELEALKNELSQKKIKYTKDYWQNVHDEAVSRFREEGQWDSVKIENRAWAAVDEQRRAWEKEKEELEKQIRRLSGVRDATWKDATIGSLKRGFQQSRLGDESFEKMMGQTNNAEAMTDILHSDEYNFEAEGYLKEGISGALEMIGQQGYLWTRPETPKTVLASTLVGAGTAALAGQLGPQALLPEEAVTAPIGAVVGFKTGIGLAAAENALRTEAGFAYNEMLENGISHETAQKIALGVGTVNATLEFIQTDKLLDAFKILNKSGTTSTVAEKLLNELIERGVDVATETMQEVAQEGVTMGGAEIAHRLDKGEGLYTLGEVSERLGDTAKSSALAFGLMNVPASVVNVATGDYATKSNQVKPNPTEQINSEQSITQPETLEQAAREVVTKRNATETAKTESISSEFTKEDSLPIQTETELKTENKAQKTNKGLSLSERLEEQSRANEPLSVEDVKKATGFGDEGSKLVTELANREGVTFSQAKRSVENAYRLGLTDIETKKVKFDNNLQKRAFESGKIDIEVQNRLKIAESKKASVYESGFTKNEYSKKLTDAEKEMFSTLAKDLKMDIEFVDKIVAFYVDGKAKEANASHYDGKMRVSSTSQKPAVAVALHEGSHRMRQLDPESFNFLMKFLYETSEQNARRLKLGDKGISVFDKVRAEYREDSQMNSSDYIEEIAVRRAETILTSPELFNKWRAELDLNPQAKNAWQKFLDIIKEVLEDIWAIITNSKMSLENKRQAQKELELFENAYRGAMNAATERANEVQNNTKSSKNLEFKINEEYNGNKRYSLDDKNEIVKSLKGSELNGYEQNSNGEELGLLGNSGKVERYNRMGKVGQTQSQEQNTSHTKSVHRSGVSAEVITSSKLTAEQAALKEQNKVEGMSTEFYIKATENGKQQSEIFVTDNTIYYPDATFERNDISVKNGVASFTEKRFEDLIEEYSVPEDSSNRNYAKAYVAYISPSDFLSLTTVNEKAIVSDSAKYGNLDVDILKNNSAREGQFLKIDFEKGEVVDHNGRHRMVMLRDAGVEKVAIVVRPNNTEKNKYNTQKMTNVSVTGQEFEGVGTAQGKVTISEIIPLSPNYRKEVREKFVEVPESISFSLKNSFSTEGMNESDIETAKNVISNLKNYAVGSRLLDGYATYTENRAKHEIAYSSAKDELDYANSYITWVNPTDFVYATTTNENFRTKLSEEAGELDIEKLSNERQPIYLRVDFETREIVGHEGRHRMLALQKAGIEKVPVIIESKNDEYWNTKPIDFMSLKGQRFAEYKKGTDMYLANMLPLSQRYADVVKELFTSKPKSEIQFSLKDSDYLKAVESGDMETAQRMVDEAAKKAMPNSKIVMPDGSLRKVFHGTNTGEFTVFNPDYIGMSSGDDGFFGKGFYFAYSEGEAKYYGAKRIIPAYLDLRNPFNFQEELQTYKGKRAQGGYAPDAVAFMNFADKFPEIAKNITVGVVEEGTYKELSLPEFSRAFKDVIDNKKFEYQEVTNEYGEKETLVLADEQTHEYEYDGKKHTYKDYGFQKRFWGEANELDVAYEYLSSSVYSSVDMYNKTRLILDNNQEFTDALKNMGYDGAIQSEYGDEAVAFYSEQIKSADPVTYDDNGNVIPLSQRFNVENNDIRYSLKDSEGNTLTESQQEYFKDSKVRDKDGNLLVVYHGSPAKFTIFKHAYLNTHGNSHGRGFYFTENKSLAEGYNKEGGQLLKGYLNIENPLSEEKITIKKADLVKLIKATCKEEAQRLVEDDEYANVREALPNTWVSNYVETYSMRMDDVYAEVANIVYSGSDNDVDIIAELTNGGAGNEIVLKLTHDILGYDGVIYENNYGHHEFVSLVSNQFKSIDNTNPTSNPDINFSLKDGVDVSPKRTTEYLDAVEDLQNGKKGASSKLAKYVESGDISAEIYEELIEKYGAIPSGERPYRDIQVPRKSGKNKKVSQTVRTILEARATPNEALPTIEKMVEDGVFSYDVYTDKKAIKDAEDYINGYGWMESYNDWMSDVKKGIVSKQHTVMGWALYNNAVNTATNSTSESERKTAMGTALDILDAMVKHQRNAAQALQATRVLKKLSPETQLYGVQKSVQTLQKELTEKYGDKAPDLKIDEELAEQFLTATTEEERTEAEKEIYKDIGRQMPSRFIDKWNAWRYLAMLGNPRTHIRNIVGNAGFAPIVVAKDMTATAIESVVSRVSRKKIVRGKSIITGNKADRTLLKAAWGDYGNVADLISNGGKYNDSAMANQQIEEGRQIFKTKPLEWARKGNSKLLEKEDMWFAQPHYAYALAQYCKANNITAEQIKKGKAIAPAREYAIKEAQKATYRDTNAFSQMVSEWGRNRKETNVVKKAFNTVVEGILPFRKTPANILVRGIEYSPIGLLKGLSYDLRQVSKGKMLATEAIDNISAGLTGTGLLTLGIYLASQGLIRGHGEDDKEEKEFKELMGHQAYALELPNGQSITLDWLAPEALPLFVGVNIWESTKGSDEELNLSTILSSVRNISEPMLEMSCLQGINDLVESVGYASSNDTSGLVSILSSAVTSYLTQGLPTILGQAERTGEDVRMTTYTEKNDFLTGDMQYTIGKASAKIPFVDYHQIPYIDAWGRREASGVALKRGLNNFLNPAYTSDISTSKMEKELLRLYEKTGEDGVFPSRADKYFTVDGKRKDLTADEYVKYATLKGQKSHKIVSDLVKSDAYKKLSDGEKVKAIKEAYDYANQKAKQSISKYKPDAWVSKADEFGENVGNYISFKANVNGTKNENGGKISKEEVVDIILDMAQNDSETWKMYLSMYDGNNDMYAYNKGVSGRTYMNFIETLSYVDQPTESGKYGTYTQEEAVNAILQLKGLSREERAILYQSVNTNWKNNPFR